MTMTDPKPEVAEVRRLLDMLAKKHDRVHPTNRDPSLPISIKMTYGDLTGLLSILHTEQSRHRLTSEPGLHRGTVEACAKVAEAAENDVGLVSVRGALRLVAANIRALPIPETLGRDDVLTLADKAVAWALDALGGYSCEECDAGIHYAQARGFDRWSMQAQMDHPECFGCNGSGLTSEGDMCPVCQPEPLSTPSGELAEVVERVRPGLIAGVVEGALRDITREQTDFLGRMEQCLGAYVGIFEDYPDGELPDEVRQDAEDEIEGLAALAVAQLAMLRAPDDPASALSHRRGEGK